MSYASVDFFVLSFALAFTLCLCLSALVKTRLRRIDNTSQTLLLSVVLSKVHKNISGGERSCSCVIHQAIETLICE